MRNINLAEIAKRGDEAVQNSHSLRVIGANANLALMQCGSYVATTATGKWIADSIKGDSERKELSFGADLRVILASGDKGSLARMGRVSDCGQYGLFGTAIVALGTFGKLKLSAYEIEAFAGMLAKGEFYAEPGSIKGNVNAGTDKEAKVDAMHGIQFCTLKGWKGLSGTYASLAYRMSNGKLAFRDIETKKNAHNDAKVLVALLGGGKEAEDAAKAVAIANAAKAGAAAKQEKVRRAAKAKK